MPTVRRPILAALAAAAILLAAALGVALSIPPAHAAAPSSTADPASMTDAQLAAALATACTPGACILTPTPANVETRWVPWVCAQVAQIAPPPGNASWQRAWKMIGPLVVGSGRCSEPSDTQLARSLAYLPGASGVPMDPASLDEVIELACPEIAAGRTTHTVYSAAVMRTVRASGVC